MNKILTGIAELDRILHGGIPEGSTVIVEGAPGIGKTTFGIQFLYYGAKQDKESGIYVTFEELPDQIYRDMLAFDWDVRQLEQQNLLRIVCVSPKLFLAELTKPDGLLDQMIRQIQCKRMVIDSISLFKYMNEDQDTYRKNIYLLRNALRKQAITALFLKEQGESRGDQLSLENYVADGVIQLSMKPHLEKFRKRTLEVVKMRGTQIIEGEHQFKITNKGIYVVPALTHIKERTITEMERIRYTPTGIARLDDVLDGGLPNGSAFLIDTNSKANYRYLLFSIYAQQLREGKSILYHTSGLMNIAAFKQHLEMFQISLEEEMNAKRIYLIEYFDRPYPPELRSNVINVSGVDNEKYPLFMKEKLAPMLNSLQTKDQWFIYYDINTIFTLRGADFVCRDYANEIVRAKAYGHTVITLCNFAEIHPEVASFLERISSGVIRNWMDGNYQYLQVVKSPQGVTSEPFIVENIDQIPYVRLL